MLESHRLCHIHKQPVGRQNPCPQCVSDMESRPPREDMTAEDRMREMRSLAGPLEVDFQLLHARIEELVGRPVWTHEMAAWDELVQENAQADRRAPDLVDIVSKIPPHIGTYIVQVEKGDEDR